MTSGTYGNNTCSILQTRALHLVFHLKVSSILLIPFTASLCISIFPFSPRIPACLLLFWGCPIDRVFSFSSNLFSSLIRFILSHVYGSVVENVRLFQFHVRIHSLGSLLSWSGADIGLIGSVQYAAEWVSLPVCGWGSCTFVLRFLLFLVAYACGISCPLSFSNSRLRLFLWRFVYLWSCSAPISAYVLLWVDLPVSFPWLLILLPHPLCHCRVYPCALVPSSPQV